VRAVFLPLGQAVAPFGDAPSALGVLGQPLREGQLEALAEVGATPTGEGGCLALGDHTWVTSPLLRAFLAACPPTGGQLAIGGDFLAYTRALQELEDGPIARVPVAWVPADRPLPDDLRTLPAVEVDLQTRLHPAPNDHPALAQAAGPPLPVTDRMVHTVAHWSHLHRVNLLALVAYGEARRRAFESGSLWSRLLTGLGLVWRARGLGKWRLASALGPRGPGCSIHPTAVVEASVLGAGVEVGPHAVVRGSYLADGVRVQEHATVNLSVIETGAVVGRGATCNLNVVMAGAMVSAGVGHQGSVIGREAFLALGVTLFDLSFGGPIHVQHRGQRVSAGTHFLGSAIGHRARLGPGVRIGYGEAVPNDALLVGDPATVARHIPPAIEPGAAVVRQGRVVPLKRPGGSSG
jgi:acetyltransferase-like isoleucine patch superfamily enzyme